MEKKLVEVLKLKEMKYDDISFKEPRRFEYDKTNEYLLKKYGCDLEHFLNRALGWVWDEMSEEGEEDE